MIIALVGPHGVGKTTLGRALAALLGLPFHGEVGRALAADPTWRSAGVTAADAAERFDEELFRREAARDDGWRGASRVIETWHPGNLAFAEQRSPAVALRWRLALQGSVAGERAWVQPLVAPRDTLAARQTEPGPLDFFRRVGLAAALEAGRLGLPCLPLIDTSNGTPDELARQIATRLAQSPPLEALGA